MSSVYHVVNYRKFECSGFDSEQTDFEKLCRSALSTKDASQVELWHRAADRLYEIPAGDGKRIILNRVVDLEQAVFGELCLVQEKDLQALLELKKVTVKLSDISTAEVFNLNERLPPPDTQFVRGMGYWFAIGNHLFFVKTHSMNAEYVHDYLKWILRSLTKVFPITGDINFTAAFDPSEIKGDIGVIKSLRVSGKAAPNFNVTVAEDASEGKENVVRSTVRKITDKFVQFQQAIPVIEALLGKEKAESLVDSLGKDEYLAVDASVKVRGRRTEKE